MTHKPFAALGHLGRYQIALIIREFSEPCVSVILRDLSISQSALSRHLSKMRRADVVSSRRDGVFMYYKLTKLGEKLLKVVE